MNILIFINGAPWVPGHEKWLTSRMKKKMLLLSIISDFFFFVHFFKRFQILKFVLIPQVHHAPAGSH